MNRATIIGALLVAVVASLCINWIEAQKTSANSYQQQQFSGSGGNSVYGGYQTSPANQQQQKRPQQMRFQQSYSQQQQSSSYQQPRPQQPRPRPQPQPQPQQQEEQQEQQQQTYSASPSSSSYEQAEADSEPASYGSVSGQPGKDFPAYTQVPKTSFSCDGLPYDYGMYADEETGCQAYHVCYNGRKDSFLCGVGTVFNQRILHCDYWYSVECGKSSQYYGSNAYMGSSQPEPGPAEANSAPVQRQQQQQPQQQQQSSYQRNEVASSSINRPANVARKQSQSFNRNNVQQQIQESY